MKCDTCKWLESKDPRSGYVNCYGWEILIANNRRTERKIGSRFGMPLADFVDCQHYKRKSVE